MKIVCILLFLITYQNVRFKNVKLVYNLCQIQCIILWTPSRKKKKSLPFHPLYCKIKEEFCRSNDVGTKERTC
jgi:hypothetical protein